MKEQANSDALLTLGEASRYLNVSQSFIRRLVRTGIIPYCRLGQKILRFRRQDLDVWLSGKK